MLVAIEQLKEEVDHQYYILCVLSAISPLATFDWHNVCLLLRSFPFISSYGLQRDQGSVRVKDGQVSALLVCKKRASVELKWTDVRSSHIEGNIPSMR